MSSRLRYISADGRQFLKKSSHMYRGKVSLVISQGIFGFHFFLPHKNPSSGLRWWLSGKESASKGGRHGFWALIQEDPKCHSNWAGVPQWLSLCSGARGLQLLKPMRPGACAPQKEKPLQSEARAPQLESSHHSPRPEKVCLQQWRPGSAKNK